MNLEGVNYYLHAVCDCRNNWISDFCSLVEIGHNNIYDTF